MELTEKISIWLTNKIGKSGEYSEDHLERIKYGIHLQLMNLHKSIIIFALAWLLGIFKLTIISLIGLTMVRTYSFGIHAKKSFSCLLFSAMTLIGTSYLVNFFQIEASYIQVLISAFIVLVSVLLYAPADTEERPILPKYRGKMRKRAVRNTVFVFLLAALFIYFDFKLYATLFCVMGLIESIMLNPITYMIFGQRYNNYIYYLQEKEAANNI